MGEREMVVASHLGKTVGWGRSLKWADWVHVTTLVSRWLDSGFGGSVHKLFSRGKNGIDDQWMDKRTMATVFD